MGRLTGLHLRACRARIAAVQALAAEPAALGGVTLRAHQRQAAAIVRAHLDRHRGCLLADDVGRGKTYVALAVARRWTRPLVVIPAALRDTWRQAMCRAGVAYPMLTHEALSRGAAVPVEPDGVIVDESHRFRNPHARRHAALADLAACAELLLMTATPVQNSTADLGAQLALYLGSMATSLDDRRMAMHVIRVESEEATAGLPRLASPRWIMVGADDQAVLEAILALPPPPRALDAGDAGALRVLALVRAWASSRAALVATIGRRRQVAVALEQSVAALRLPTRAELRGWMAPGQDSVQLGFAPLLASHQPAAVLLPALASHVAAERAALAHLSGVLAARRDVDDARCAALLGILDAHPDARVLAFTERASTARAYWLCLRHRAGIGLLTAAGARIASGPLPRAELLDRFAPAARGVPAPAARERVSLLVSTDLLSEGMNLQDASVVVHLDLPWNPARLAQRVGRVRRPGTATEVASYLIAPPASTELLLAVERRLRDKLGLAHRLLGPALDVLPLVRDAPAALASVEVGNATARALVRARIDGWRAGGTAVVPRRRAPLVAGCVAPMPGWLAACVDGSLVCAVDGTTGDGAAALDRATTFASGAPRAVHHEERDTALDALARYSRTARAVASCGVAELVGHTARAAARHVASLVARAPRHARASVAAGAARVRGAMAHPLSLGQERALDRLLAERGTPAERWLAAAEQLLRRAGGAPHASLASDDRPAALVVFGPETHDGGP